MLLPKGTVFAVVDGENFELYRNEGTEAEPRLEALTVPELTATNFSAGVKDHDKVSRFTPGAPPQQETKLLEAGHVAAVTEWLNAQALAGAFERVLIIADPQSLGEMRRHYHKALEAVLAGEVGKTVAGRPPAEIVAAARG